MDTKRNENRIFDIVSGPNRDVLFDACKYAYDKNVKFNVDFGVSMGLTMPPDDPGCMYVLADVREMVIGAIGHEDGSGNSLNIYGHCRANLQGPTGGFVPYRFKAYYDVKTRKGRIKFL